jgi:hypothetical protein
MNAWYAAQTPNTRRKMSPSVPPISPLPDLKKMKARLESKCQSKHTLDRLIRSQRDFTT